MSVEFAGRPQKVGDDELCGTARVRGGGGGDWSYTRGKTASEFSSRQQRPHIGGAWALDNTLTFTLHCRRVGGWDRGGPFEGGCWGVLGDTCQSLTEWKNERGLMHSTSRRLIIGLLAVIHTLLIFVVDHQGH